MPAQSLPSTAREYGRRQRREIAAALAAVAAEDEVRSMGTVAGLVCGRVREWNGGGDDNAAPVRAARGVDHAPTPDQHVSLIHPATPTRLRRRSSARSAKRSTPMNG